MLNSGFVDPASVADRVRQLHAPQLRDKNYPKAVEYGKRWIEASGGNDLDAYVLTGKANTSSRTTPVRSNHPRAVDAAKRAGKPVKEQWLQIILSAYDRMDDAAGVAQRSSSMPSVPNQKRWKESLDTVYASPDNEDRPTWKSTACETNSDVIDRPDDYVKCRTSPPRSASRAKPPRRSRRLGEEMDAKDGTASGAPGGAQEERR